MKEKDNTKPTMYVDKYIYIYIQLYNHLHVYFYAKDRNSISSFNLLKSLP